MLLVATHVFPRCFFASPFVCLFACSFKADGCTNISSGLALGYQCVKRSGVEGRIFLLSDGQVNAGLSAPDLTAAASWFHENHVTMTTYGLGDSFDEALLTSTVNG